MTSLLVELFTEELPPRALRSLAEDFSRRITDSLARAHLCEKEARGRMFATPRRLALLLPDVRAQAEDRAEVKKLMPAKVAFDAHGNPSAALVKRLEKEGANAASVERRKEGDSEYAFLTQTIPGLTLTAALQIALAEATEKLPIPKLMSYQLADGISTVQFVRPAHGLVALHGSEILQVSILGLKAGRVTHGHRFQGVKDIEIAAADAYEEALAAHGKVMADFDVRRAAIDQQLRARAAELGASLGPESDVASLLDEVTALVEYPSVYAGEFEAEFLAVPQECLVLTMRTNQKYFPLFDATGKLSNRFLIVSNMSLTNPRNIVEGNQRVVRPRLADARFFYETDRKTKLEDRLPSLANIVYHNKLGSQLERVNRVEALAMQIGGMIGADPQLAARAARLAKADLTSNMVGEFPELQGTMGRYYARGDDDAVATAIEQHYRPRFAGDVLPEGAVAAAVALADKLEILTGMFGIGQQPTGDKDPFALRRHALGVIRILIEREFDAPLAQLIDAAFATFHTAVAENARSLLVDFVFDRLRGYLRDSGYTANEVEAVLAMNPAQLATIPRQLSAVRAFANLPEAASLASANKRVANILRQAEAKGETFAQTNAATMADPLERGLFNALDEASRLALPLFDAGDYTGYLKNFAVLKAPVDAFFESVMVMVDDPAIRGNRLALLRDLRQAMNRVADLSKLAA